jgi:hypothetical protein
VMLFALQTRLRGCPPLESPGAGARMRGGNHASLPAPLELFFQPSLRRGAGVCCRRRNARASRPDSRGRLSPQKAIG